MNKMARFNLKSLLVLLVVCFGSCQRAKNLKSKSVTTLLDAKWDASPLVLEVAEYLADENVDLFWTFIDAVSSYETALVDIENDRERYETIMTEVSKLLSPSEITVMKLGLSLHIYSPKVEMFEQMALERNLPPCPVVADVGGKLVCGVEELNAVLKQKHEGHIETFNLDHHFPGSENNSLTIILYGEIGTPEFGRFHRELKQHAFSGKVDYIIRHHVKERPNKKLRLSGYGVELQMKSTEYKAQDDTEIKSDGSGEEAQVEDDEEVEGFNFNTLKRLYPDKLSELKKFRQHLVETSSELAPLKVWQFQELSLQAAERIMASPKEEAIHVLTQIAQNFPMQAKSLVHTVVNNNLKNEIKFNQDLFITNLNLQPSDTALFINGMFFDLDVVDMISLLEIIRQEQRTMQGLHSIGISNELMSALLELDLNEGNSGTQEFAIDIRDSAINWINDLESDSKYKRWGSSLMELLRPTFPGMLRTVRKNLYNLVLVINPIKIEAKPLLKLAESFCVHLAPLRVGLVFAVPDDKSVTGLTDASVGMLCVYNFVSQTKSPEDGLAFITDIYASVKEDRDIEVDDIKILLRKKFPHINAEDVLGEDSDYDFGRSLSKDFIQRTGLSAPAALLNGIPLAQTQLNTEDFEEAVLTEVMQQTPGLQKAVYRGEFSDSHDTIDYLMTRPNVMPRLNQRVLTQESSQFIDMSGKAVTKLEPALLMKASNRDLTVTAVENLKYFQVTKKTNQWHMLTHWVIGDLNCPKSKTLLLNALQYTKANSDARLTFIPNVEKESVKDQNILNKAVLAALNVYPSDEATNFVISLLEKKDAVTYESLPIEIKSILDQQELYLKMLRVYCQRVLNLSVKSRAILANGRLLGPLRDDESFDSEDFVLLERYSLSSYGNKIKKALNKLKDEGEDLTSNQMLRIIPLLVSRPQTRSRFEIVFHEDEYSVIKLPAADSNKPAFEIAAIVDPVSRGAQKLGPILSTLQTVLNCNIRVFLNSVDKCSDMPLKSFYRFVLESEIQFNDKGRQTSGPIARFSGLPTSPLLTQNLHVPENWLVNVVRSVYDLDNIRLDDVESVVHSEFELEYLLLEGHCFDSVSGAPPRGLQMTLGTETNPVQVDTIVMANLGYFQLKANPGAWILRLRQGRSSDIYDIVGHEGSDTPADSKDIKVLISSLRSHVLKLKVTKKPDMKNADLLVEDKANNGIWNSITSSLGGGADEEVDEKINIFSLASGHLYERFLRIMMLSVLKHTKTPVKFWFLKNYLSPQLKDFLPHMAKKYGFEFELVEYKWPRWLHQQTEKQRIIWGYKILFLDVLFPLDVKKIIFVDADQVVRTDMRELQEFDLGGAPYGYTPFCDSRTEMDGFRFWKQGYWRNHLQGRKYHISALYVVDLKRFRRIAAGDRLRGQYQALSQDRNSLSNLDQDLPNNMIHQVAIKSLPQEWLWCETWCDDSSKKKAKTIDLCNNPLTKEAKLSAAVRILPEWKDYDNEIRKLQQEIESGETDTKEEKATSRDIHSEL